MSGKVIGANLKFHRPLRQGGLSQYLVTLMGALTPEGIKKTVVRVFPHNLALLSETSTHQDGKRMAFRLGPAPLGGVINIGSQDIHPVEDGSFTGAPLSPGDLQSLGLKHTLGGHSETVVYFGVKDADVAKKLDAALRAGIHMTVCLGVMPDIEAAGKGREALAQQVRDRIVAALTDAQKTGAPNFDIAWEPVAAIKGFADLWGLPARPPRDEDIVEAHAIVRQALNDAGYQNYADTVAVSYGGSAGPKNAEQLLKLVGVDGLLVGTASWDANNMVEMCQIAERVG